MKLRNVLIAICCIFLLFSSAGAASDDEENGYHVVHASDKDVSDKDGENSENKDSGNVIDWQEWINPVDGVKELESSPVGNPLKRFVNLIIGLVILFGAASILKSWFKSNSEDGEKASDGYLGMAGKAVGALVMVACVAMYFYFLGYQL